MCGRFVLGSVTKLQSRFSTLNNLAFEASYNITPGMFVPVITHKSPNEMSLMRWGFIPEWAKNKNFNLINIREETFRIREYFRTILIKNRCLIPSDGFYEWQKVKTDGKPGKIPHYIYLKDNPLFSFAGVYSELLDAEGKKINTFAIITCKPNYLIKEIHNRMPVILPKEDEEKWLDDKNPNVNELFKLLAPYPPARMQMHKVGKEVGSPNTDGADLINPLKN